MKVLRALTIRQPRKNTVLMYDFLDEIALRYSREDAAATKELLGALKLAVPKPDQYFLGKEKVMILLDPFGMTLQIGQPLPSPEHDLILRPA